MNRSELHPVGSLRKAEFSPYVSVELRDKLVIVLDSVGMGGYIKVWVIEMNKSAIILGHTLEKIKTE